ncbi:MAG: hypothetical protein U5K75_10000 [Ahrensia sp.]|nr:hypothetical protein [Ahrensia sp.]
MICFSKKGHEPMAKRVKALASTTMLFAITTLPLAQMAMAAGSGFVITVDGETVSR